MKKIAIRALTIGWAYWNLLTMPFQVALALVFDVFVYLWRAAKAYYHSNVRYLKGVFRISADLCDAIEGELTFTEIKNKIFNGEY